MVKNNSKLVYIILSKNLGQLKELVDELYNENTAFVIHIDKKLPEKEYLEFKGFYEGKKEIVITKKFDCKWGSINSVKATLFMIEKALENFDFFSLVHLSGQDFPIKNNEIIYNFLKKHKEKNFFDIYTIDEKLYNGFSRSRHINFHIFGKKIRFKIIRKVPNNLEIYQGSQWYILNKKSCEYLINYLKENKKIIKYFKYSIPSDEMLIQTVLINNSEIKKNSILDNNLKHYEFLEENGRISSHPKTFTKNDLKTLLNSKKLFARKFDKNQDKDILKLLIKILKNDNKMSNSI